MSIVSRISMIVGLSLTIVFTIVITRFLIKTSNTIVTIFTPSNKIWLGSGVNVWASNTNTANQIKGLNCTFARLWISSNDSDIVSLSYDDSQMDALWLESPQIAQWFIANSVTMLENNGILLEHVIFTMDAPVSWLNTGNTLTGQGLISYSRLWVSLINILAQYHNISVKYIESANEPNGRSEYISPSDYYNLTLNIKHIASARNITGFQIIGPGISSVLMETQTIEPWTIGFASDPKLLDTWSIHVYEYDIDAIDNDGFVARTYVRRQLALNVAMMNSVNPKMPIFATEYATLCQTFANGKNQSINAPNTIDYAFRVTDNFCGMLSNGVEVAILWQLATQSWNPADIMGLWTTTGTVRPEYTAFSMANSILPVGGVIYIDNPYINGDQTIKALVASSTNFGMILSRYQTIDALDGNLSIRIKNRAIQLTNISFTAFPTNITTSNITFSSYANGGYIYLELSNIPYSSIIYLKGSFVQ